MCMVVEKKVVSGVTDDTHIVRYDHMITPDELRSKFPPNASLQSFIYDSRNAIKAIMDGKDSRKLMIVGPCSIHNVDEALEYAQKLKNLSDKVSDRFLLVMRCYFEKPRTTVGWKGLLNDPDINDSFDMQKGLFLARKLLFEVNTLGIPCATEFLDPFTPQYIGDLVSWAAIGARTTESQTHRQMVSGLSMPVGFKNATSGDVSVAINAILSAKSPHSFLGITNSGFISKIKTKGNNHVHLVLRGGDNKVNYDVVSVNEAQSLLRLKKVSDAVLIDCSHANSNKDYTKQSIVLEKGFEQIVAGNASIIGFMLESNLMEGNQSVSDSLQKGVSITDACIGWEETESLLLYYYDLLEKHSVD